MKNQRQTAILELLNSRDIRTQHELAEALQVMGYMVTQSTVSRDIREMKLVKVASAAGGYKYAPPGKNGREINERLIRILRDSLQAVDFAGHMVVVKTLSGSANSAAEALDSMDWPEMLGSIAGDNTIFLVARREADAEDIAEKIRAIAWKTD